MSTEKDTVQTEHIEIWDRAVRECMEVTIRHRYGMPGPYVNEMRKLLHVDWDWENDKEFMKEFYDED